MDILLPLFYKKDAVIGRKVRYTKKGKTYYRALPGEGKEEQKKGRRSSSPSSGRAKERLAQKKAKNSLRSEKQFPQHILQANKAYLFEGKYPVSVEPLSIHTNRHKERAELIKKMRSLHPSQIKEAMELIRGQIHQEAQIFFDPETNELLNFSIGETHTCDFYFPNEQGIASIHNHDLWATGEAILDNKNTGSFSPNDIMGDAQLKMGEAYVVAPSYTYKVTPVNNWSKEDVQKLEKTFLERRVDWHTQWTEQNSNLLENAPSQAYAIASSDYWDFMTSKWAEESGVFKYERYNRNITDEDRKRASVAEKSISL